MKKDRSAFMMLMVTALALIAGTGLVAAQESSQNPSGMSSSPSKGNAAMSANGQTQKGKMGETEHAGPQKSKKAKSGKMSAPKSNGE